MSLVLQDQLVLSPATAEHLQEEIDTIEAGSDVTDVVGTYADLQAYDTSTLTDKDVIKVLDDETEDHAQTYYRWSASSRSFSYIGKIAKPAVDSVNGKTGAVVLDSNDVGALPLSGGTMTGDLSFDNGTGYGGFVGREPLTSALSLGYRISGTNYPSLMVDNRGFMPKTSLGYNLGYSSNKWARVYSAKLNNGDDINIPNASGTMVVTNYTGATQGQVLQLDSNNNAVWADVDGLPDQTGQTGKVLTTDGTDASWGSPVVATFRAWGANE